MDHSDEVCQNRWLVHVWRHRATIIAALALITAAALGLARNLHADNSPLSWFLSDDIQVREYESFRSTFGSDDVVLVAVRGQAPFWQETSYRTLEGLSNRLCDLPAVEDCVSLTRVDQLTDNFIVSSEDRREFEVDLATESPDQRRERLLQDPLIAGRLLSKDGEWALVLLNLASYGGSAHGGTDAIATVREVLTNTELEHAIAGASVTYESLNQLSRSETSRLLSLSILVIVVLMTLTYRRVAPVLASFLAVVVAIIWMLGFAAAAGYSVNVLTSIAPVVVLVIGVGDCIHVLRNIARHTDTPCPEERILKGVGPMLWPCFLTTTTTALAFGSLVVTRLPMTSDLGAIVAVGVMASYVTGMFGCVLVAGSRSALLPMRTDSRLNRLSASLVGLGFRRWKITLLITMLVVAGSVVMATRISVDAHPLEQLPSGHAVIQDVALIQQILGGTVPLNFVVSGTEGIPAPALLRGMQDWEEKALESGLAQWSRSEVTGIKRANQLMNELREGEFRLPDDDGELKRARRMYHLMAGDRSRIFLSPEGEMRVTFGIHDVPASELQDHIEEIAAMASFPKATNVKPVGLLWIWSEQVQRIVRAQIVSFASAFGLVSIVLLFVARHGRLMVVALVANVLPVVFVLGLMGLAGMHLDLGTVAVASVILGLVVDNTIHFVHRLRHAHDASRSIQDAGMAVARTTGSAIVVATLVLAGGFSVLTMAQVTSVASFGVLVAAAMIVAMFSDLIVGPATLRALPSRAKRPGDC